MAIIKCNHLTGIIKDTNNHRQFGKVQHFAHSQVNNRGKGVGEEQALEIIIRIHLYRYIFREKDHYQNNHWPKYRIQIFPRQPEKHQAYDC